MSGNKRAAAAKSAVPQKKQRRKSDARIRRTHVRLGMALLQLICEKPMDDVTVQEVLDRASVGRSTFYLHFRDKNDLLLSELERFLEFMSSSLSIRGDTSLRVAPVAEMFEHIGAQNRLYRALVDADRLDDFFGLAQEYFARGIERRLRDSGRCKNLQPPELAARAYASAASLLGLLRWWIDHGGKPSPQTMDELFHRMVWTGVR